MLKKEMEVARMAEIAQIIKRGRGRRLPAPGPLDGPRLVPEEVSRGLSFAVPDGKGEGTAGEGGRGKEGSDMVVGDGNYEVLGVREGEGGREDKEFRITRKRMTIVQSDVPVIESVVEI